MAGYLKVNNLSDIEDFIKGKIKALKDSAEMFDSKSEDVGVTNALSCKKDAC